MWYGLIASNCKRVTKSWNDLNEYIKLYPYAKFRKFKTEEEALEFIERNNNYRAVDDITLRGDVYNNLYISINYYIREGTVYYNIFLNELNDIYIDIIEKKDLFTIEKYKRTIKVEVPMKLNPDLILSHVIVINNILDIVGDLVDIELIIEYFSIFCILETYTGNKYQIVKLQEKIRNRKGNIAYTLRRGEQYNRES